MGLAYSVTTVFSSLSAQETITDEYPDGSRTVTKRNNPIITSVIAVSSAALLVMFIDGGDGMVTNILGHRCIECSQKLVDKH